MKQRGEITVFLSMCLLCVSALLCVMTESARMAGSRYYFQVAANSGIDILFSRYHRSLWEDYRIFALEYDSQEELAEQLFGYINEYLSVDNWYPMELESVRVERLSGLADREGQFLAEEVLDYMKFGAVSQFMIQPEQGEQLLKDVTEAAGAGVLIRAYDSQEKEVRKLEKAAEELVNNMQQQEQLREQIEKALQEGNGEIFFITAESYRRIGKRYSELMKSYEKRAEALAARQQESKETVESIKPDLQNSRRELFEKQWNPYEAYIEEDGKRYQEFLVWQKAVERNLELLKEVEDLAGQSAWEQDGDEEETENSFESAARLWKKEYISSNIVTTVSSGDKEKQNLLEEVRKLAEGGLLKLVLPEDMDISQKVIFINDLPSKTMSTGQSQDRKTSEADSKGAGKAEEKNTSDREAVLSSGESLVDRVLINEYCGRFFPNALNQKKGPIQYELEYLLQGAGSDRENLEKTIGELFAVREGLNFIHILSDSQKRQEARALALMTAGGIGLTPLTEIMAYLIMGIWAMGESLQDLRVLMDGGKIPLWKQKDDWSLSLEELLDMGRRNLPDIDRQKTSTKGFSYEEYLKLLLLKEEPKVKHMRMLDLMQLNIREQQPGFFIQNCAYHVDIVGKACGKHLFFALPIVDNFISREKNYSLEAAVGKAY